MVCGRQTVKFKSFGSPYATLLSQDHIVCDCLFHCKFIVIVLWPLWARTHLKKVQKVTLDKFKSNVSEEKINNQLPTPSFQPHHHAPKNIFLHSWTTYIID